MEIITAAAVLIVRKPICIRKRFFIIVALEIKIKRILMGHLIEAGIVVKFHTKIAKN